ncbi:hypothetical protein StoSoilB3_01550 [Arthrobacter sp. StoSoilB3]|nr:hypothetical protein NtRootA2_01540 [Arthrobacter sp. NtRootA2]BCW29823.1 hypothetical protein NtRootD5_01540 [Arthrobacter sp. NtRootD5]BCW38620.1 hypothetical protein StoSoilB3_01550 [Arthrobacter sp. StoSoilB3]
MTVTDSRDIFPEAGACVDVVPAEAAAPEVPDSGLPLASDVTSVDMRIPQGLDLVSGERCR